MKSTLLTLMLLAGLGTASAQYPQGPPPQGYGQNGYGPNGGYGQGGWDLPPREFNNIRQRGFRDGIQGAQRDFENHRRPDVNNRDEFRNPNFIPRRDRRDYREGFRRGYDVGIRHFDGRGARR